MTKAMDRALRNAPPRVVSVGTKLTATVIGLVLVVTSAIYFGLSAYQRESLLSAKEMAATAVTRLFADSCAPAVVFNDEAGIEEELKTLGRNADVEYAGVWSVESGGTIGPRLAELVRGKPELPAAIPSSIELGRRADRVVVLSPVRDPANKTVAVSAIAFSLARENAAVADVERRTLIISGSVALVLTLLLMALVRLAIVRPLGALVVAAKQLEEGRLGDIAVRSNDEIGVLASAFRSMAAAIQSREERIRARNRDMRLVLDNVGQGFITLDLHGRMSDERSRIVDEWFGEPHGTPAFSDYLSGVDEATGLWFELGWASVCEDVLPLDLCLDQLPRVLRKGQQTFELAYRPIVSDGQLDKTIVVITDVTARIERERAEQMQREIMSIFQRVTADRAAFEDFFAEANALVLAIVTSDGSDLPLLCRQIHTLKGNCALFGIERMADFCHHLEDQMSELGEMPAAGEKETLQNLWTQVTAVRAQFSNYDGRVQLERDEYDAFLEDLRRRVDHDVLTATCLTWQSERACRRLAVLDEQIQALAVRLGKAKIEVQRAPTKLRLPARTWGPFWSAFAHVIRNVVDHGVETTEERESAGKSAHATVMLSVEHDAHHVVVTVVDDGRGIDWGKIAQAARERGLPCSTPSELEAALFSDGVSSRSCVTDVSGRGVGLSSVRETVQKLGGRVHVSSEPGSGTTFRFVLPQSTLVDEVGSRAVTTRLRDRLRSQPTFAHL